MGTELRPRGETVTLPAGQHTVSFADIEGASGCFKPASAWITPDEQTVMIVPGQATTRTGAYASSEKAMPAAVPGADANGSLVIVGLLATSLAYARRRGKRVGSDWHEGCGFGQ